MRLFQSTLRGFGRSWLRWEAQGKAEAAVMNETRSLSPGLQK